MIGRGRDLSLVRNKITLDVRSEAPVRLDQYLLRNLEWRSRTRIQALIQQGHIKVNDESTKPSRKVRGGDVVTVELSLGEGQPASYGDLKIETLYEDRWLVAVNKPPGLLVHPVGRHVYDTLMNYMHHEYQGQQTEDGERIVPRLCHRIDRDTTGVLVIGKDPHVHRQVLYQFENRLVHKEYLALVRGRYPTESGSIDIPIGAGRCLRSCLEHPVLKPSCTRIRRVQSFPRHTLLGCTPLTGRQNQIRVHLAAKGYPLVGDERYGDGEAPAGFPERFLLHSRRLRFFHPRWKSLVELTAPLPEDFRNLLGDLVR